ncbi:MAG: TonB-dependent receptor [Polyangiaceae bacterium]
MGPIGAVELDARQTRGVAGTFGDPFEAVAALPGVASTASGLSYFYVRGAPPADTGYFLDGIPLPALFHIGPGASVVPPALAGTIDFYPATAPSRYGRFVGGIIAATTLVPDREFHADGAAGLFEANALVESPIDDRSTALVAGRYAYPNWLLSRLAPGASLAYWDYTARITRSLTAADTLSIFAIGASDQEHDAADEITPVSSQFHRIDLRLDHRFAEGSLRIGTTFGLDRTLEQFSSGSNELATQASGRLRLELEQRLGDDNHLSAGMDLNATRNRFQYSGNVDDTLPLDFEQLGGAYVDLSLHPVRGVEIVPGVRMDGYRSSSTVTPSVDPKVAARMALGPVVTSSTTFGIVHQEPTTYAIPTPALLLDASGGLQQVIQIAQGATIRLPWDLTTSVTGFYNIDHAMTDVLFDCGTFALNCNVVQRVDGRTYGLEALLRRPLTHRLGGWLAYTLSRAQRNIGALTFLSPFDRTHVLSAVIRYDFGAGIHAGVRATYYSGRPETVNVFLSGSEVNFAFGPGQFGQHRLPDFYRVDVRAEKRWELGRRRWLAAVLEFFNATLSKESVDYQCSPTTWVCSARDIGPVSLPSIGIEGGI